VRVCARPCSLCMCACLRSRVCLCVASYVNKNAWQTRTHASFFPPLFSSLGRMAGRRRVVFFRVVFFRPLAPSKHNGTNGTPHRKCPRPLPSTHTNRLCYMQRRPCSRGWRGRGLGGRGGGWGRGGGRGGSSLEKDWSEYLADSGDWVGAFGL
jgi:hypothetical protein